MSFSSASSKGGDGEEAVRHAEKNRTATCLFADHLAKLSVAKMQKVRAAISSGAQVPGQNVMAAVIMYLKPTPQEVEEELNLIHGGDADKLLSSRLVVVSLGLGTKYLNSSVIMAEESLNKRSTGGFRVRDCHAEVLARRGFKRYLYSEILKLLDDDADGGGGAYAASNKFFALDAQKKLIIKPNVEFHLYTSSQPCGNAAIKKWVTSKSEQFQADIPAYAYPSRQPSGHQAVQIMAMHEGQASFLKKKSFGSMIITNKNDCQDEVVAIEAEVINGKNGERGVGGSSSSSSNSITFTVGSVESNMDFTNDIDALDSSLYSTFIVPEGCRPCRGFVSQRVEDDKKNGSGENVALLSSSSSSSSYFSSSSLSSSSIRISTDGILMTCSDKILQWNVMGLQGGLILSLLSSSLSSSEHTRSGTGGIDIRPLTVPPIITCKSIIVGRKYSQQTALRGLCCRFENTADNRKKRRTNDKISQYSSENDLRESTDISLASATNSAMPTLQSTSYSSLPHMPLFTMHHPLIMGTSIKFDESAIVTGVPPSESGESKASGGGSYFKDATEPNNAVETGLRSTGALFLDFNCICWWEDEGGGLSTQSLDIFKYSMHCEGGKCCVIDGRSGFLASTTLTESISPSEVCSAAFFSLYKKVLMHNTQGGSGPLGGSEVSYSSAKNSGLSGLYSAEKCKLFACNNSYISSSSNNSSGGGGDGSTGRNELDGGGTKEKITRCAVKSTKLGYWIGTKSLLNFVDYCSKTLSDER